MSNARRGLGQRGEALAVAELARLGYGIVGRNWRCAAGEADIGASEMMRRAEHFYAIHRASGRTDIVPYHPDTQGVFDIAHLLHGNDDLHNRFFGGIACGGKECATQVILLRFLLTGG